VLVVLLLRALRLPLQYPSAMLQWIVIIFHLLFVMLSLYVFYVQSSFSNAYLQCASRRPPYYKGVSRMLADFQFYCVFQSFLTLLISNYGLSFHFNLLLCTQLWKGRYWIPLSRHIVHNHFLFQDTPSIIGHTMCCFKCNTALRDHRSFNTHLNFVLDRKAPALIRTEVLSQNIL
jgi:hypothetical protein